VRAFDESRLLKSRRSDERTDSNESASVTGASIVEEEGPTVEARGLSFSFSRDGLPGCRKKLNEFEFSFSASAPPSC